MLKKQILEKLKKLGLKDNPKIKKTILRKNKEYGWTLFFYRNDMKDYAVAVDKVAMNMPEVLKVNIAMINSKHKP